MPQLQTCPKLLHVSNPWGNRTLAEHVGGKFLQVSASPSFFLKLSGGPRDLDLKQKDPSFWMSLFVMTRGGIEPPLLP